MLEHAEIVRQKRLMCFRYVLAVESVPTNNHKKCLCREKQTKGSLRGGSIYGTKNNNLCYYLIAISGSWLVLEGGMVHIMEATERGFYHCCVRVAGIKWMTHNT